MGMFNNVHCDMPLPDTPEGLGVSKYGFQTKRLGENLMHNYRITAEGYVEKEEFHHVATGRWYKWDLDAPLTSMAKIWVDPPVEPGPDINWEGPFPEWERIEDGWQLVDFTGEFNFYADSEDSWLEYVATVERGKVTKLVRDRKQEWRMKNYR